LNYARVSLRLNLTITKEGAGKDLDRHTPLVHFARSCSVLC